jgi:hypothetical protein
MKVIDEDLQELVENGFEEGNYIIRNAKEEYETLGHNVEALIPNDKQFKLIPVNPGTALYTDYGLGDTYALVITDE